MEFLTFPNQYIYKISPQILRICIKMIETMTKMEAEVEITAVC